MVYSIKCQEGDVFSGTRLRSKMKIALLFFVVLLSLILFRRGYACEPCAYILTLEETAEKADLIVIGHALDGITPAEFGGDFVGPDWMTIEVTHVIKGELSDNTIRVNSWNGMCQYGIVLGDDAPYVIFLQDLGDMYDAVEHGCAVKTLPVFDSFVEYQGERLPLKDFFSQLGINFNFQNDYRGTVKTPYLLIGFLVIASGILFLLVIRRLRMNSGGITQ
jgi:hypothetical protein